MTGNSAEAAYPGRLTGGATRVTRHRTALLLITACSTALALAGCARSTGGVAGGRSSAGADTGVTVQSAQPNASTTAGTGDGGSTGGSSGGNGNGNGGTPTWKPSASPSAPSGPQIVYFKVDGSAACPESGPNFTSPGGVTITWKVTGATKVALSIDDPNFFAQHGSGSYGSNYGPTGSLNLSFGCSVPIGQTQTHTYSLDTMDGGAHRSMTIKASAVNHG